MHDQIEVLTVAPPPAPAPRAVSSPKGRTGNRHIPMNKASLAGVKSNEAGTNHAAAPDKLQSDVEAAAAEVFQVFTLV